MKKLKQYENSDYTHFVAQGYMHGYPECCILEFIEKRCIKEDYSVILKNNYSGFIPCSDHANKIVNKELKVKDLIQSYRAPFLMEFKEVKTPYKEKK